MVFHIAGADVADFALELVKQIDRVFAQNVDQHVQPATVRHADTDFFGAIPPDPLNRLAHHRDEALATF